MIFFDYLHTMGREAMYKKPYVSKALMREIEYRESMRLGNRLPSDKRVMSTAKSERPAWLRAMRKY